MGAHISFVCDNTDCKNEHGHKTYLPLFFDSVEETWNDMIAFVRTTGWYVELVGGKVTKTLCPKHKKEQDTED